MVLPLKILTFLPFHPEALVTLGIILLLLFISAMVSGSETAFFSLSPTDISDIKKRRSAADNAIIRLLGKQDYLLATILIANNLVNICIIILSNNLINKLVYFDSTAWEFVTKTIVVTFVLLLFGEIMPKIFSAYHPLRFARIVSVPLMGLKQLMKPFSFLLIKSGNVVNEKLARKKSLISIDELSDAIEITKNQSEEERQMLSGIVNFVNTEAVEIMKPRMDVVALDIESDFAEVKKTIIESGFSRIPVYEESLDNIRGILYVKDMVPFIVQSDEFYWQAHLRKPYFVPEHKKINDLMEEFQSEKVHIAIVVDEYGATQGIVSLEDILEEIVGEISDESDAEEATYYKKIDDRTYIFDGKTHISDFCKVMKFDEEKLEEISGDIETLAGLMLELKHDFLNKGDSVTSNGFRFTVTSLDGRRIEKIRVNILDDQQ